MTIVIESPHIPPSQNACYRNVPGKGRAKTQRYRDWATAFGYDLNKAMAGKKGIDGPYSISITIDAATRHKLSDIGNREKVLSDILVQHQVVKDDRFAESILIRWGSAGGGVRVVIEPIDALDELLSRIV